MRVWLSILLVVLSPSLSLAEMVLQNEPIQPLPLWLSGKGTKKIALGKKLFEEKSLSRNQTVSCSTCHDLKRSGVDGLSKSIGIDGAIGDFNSPTVFNSGYNFRQFWNGRAKSLEEQIEGPIEHPKEMGSSWEEVVRRLAENSEYRSLFNEVYASGVTADNVKDALASFERSLVTPNSRFDQYLRGDEKAISSFEKLGYQRFKTLGCVSCHQGMNVGGNMFQTMGIMGNFFKDRSSPPKSSDLGRYEVTHKEQDRHVFKVPSLRNVELTAPYFHDGSVMDLGEAVKTMARYQLGRMLSKDEVDSLVAFLKTLTGETPSSLRGPEDVKR